MGDRAKYPDRSSGEVVVATAATVLPFLPIMFGEAEKWSSLTSVMPVFDLEIQAVSATNLTDTELWGGYEFAQAIASDDVDTVDFANNELDIASHGLETGDGPLQISTTTTLPDGLELLTDYWVIKVDAGTIQLATTKELASLGTAVTFTDAGTGTHTILGASATSIRWFSYGLLGIANDGAVALDTKQGYTTRINHRPRTQYYAISATLSAAVATTCTLHAVQDVQ